jgi:hypothetical protein
MVPHIQSHCMIGHSPYTSFQLSVHIASTPMIAGRCSLKVSSVRAAVCAEFGLNSTHIRLTEYAASEPTGVVLLFGCASVQLEALGVSATPTLIIIRADHSFLSLPGAIRRDLIKSALGVTLLPTPLDHVQAWFETRW